MFEKNNDLHRVSETPVATDFITHRRWQWNGHVMREESTDDARIVLMLQPNGRRKRGRPKDICRTMVKKSETSLDGGFGGKLHKWRGREQNKELCHSAICDI